MIRKTSSSETSSAQGRTNQISQENDRLGFITFWIAAVLILFWQLASGDLRGSEARWAETVRNMLLTDHLFHPIINNEIYFDKPLLSYWFIVAVTFIYGTLNELATRIPSALAGLLGLWATVHLGRKLWCNKVGLTAGWLMLTSYCFILWSRTAAADMANLTAIMLAVTWFLAWEHKPGFISYFVFYLICVLGAHIKGLAAIAVPLLVVFPFLIRENRWKKHVNFYHLLAVFLCSLIYFAPFYYAASTDLPLGYKYPGAQLSGLELVYRENILRFIQPFDHKNPFYLYLYAVPRIVLPWTPLFIAATYWACTSIKRLDKNTRWLLESIILIFLFFSVSGSRRWYYILPILPFCTLLTANYLASPSLEKLKRFCLGLIGGMYLVLSVVYIITPALWPLFAPTDFAPPAGFTWGMVILGILTLIPWVLKKVSPEFLPKLTGTGGNIAHLITITAISMGMIFGVLMVSFDEFRTTTRAFARELKNIVGTPEEMAYYHINHPDITFYLNFPGPIEVFETPEDLRNLLQNRDMKRVIVSYRKYINPLLGDDADNARVKPILNEAMLSWETKRSGSKLVAWEISDLQLLLSRYLKTEKLSSQTN